MLGLFVLIHYILTTFLSSALHLIIEILSALDACFDVFASAFSYKNKNYVVFLDGFVLEANRNQTRKGVFMSMVSPFSYGFPSLVQLNILELFSNLPPHVWFPSLLSAIWYSCSISSVLGYFLCYMFRNSKNYSIFHPTIHMVSLH